MAMSRSDSCNSKESESTDQEDQAHEVLRLTKQRGVLVDFEEPLDTLTEQELAELAYPDHHPETALANYRAGREVWDTNGDMR